jgi:diaminopimelate epimerase
MRLFKAHGLGNDYLVLESGEPMDGALARSLCDRHRGPGGDGVLEPHPPQGQGPWGVRIWNPDGSVAEKSGNGLRIFAWWLHHLQGAPDRFEIAVAAERVSCEIEGELIGVEMGRARFGAGEIPVDRARLDEPLELGDEALAVVTVGMGNPHCVVFRTETDLDTLPWRAWGERIERHSAFPARTNVQFARVTQRGLELRIWERGAGPTLASGSSACAAAAAAVRTGRLPAGPVEVLMPGGTLEVLVREDFTVRLRGPVAPVGRFELDGAWRP